jgi:hypothetical protein
MAGGPMGIVSFLFLSLEVITTTMKQQTWRRHPSWIWN